MASNPGQVVERAFKDCEKPLVSRRLPFPEACAKHCHGTLGCAGVYIIASKSLSAQTNALNELTLRLGDSVKGTRIGIGPHTPISHVLEVVHDIQSRNLQIDCLVTLGAGSLTDAAKLVRLALANSATTEQDMDTLWGTPSNNPRRRQRIVRPNISLVHIPTSLSGGEYQALAGGTESAASGHGKRGFHCEAAAPDLVIQDPELCLTTPRHVWLSTGVRAVDHCVETLCSLQSNDEADAAAATGLTKMVVGLLACKAEPESVEARAKCQQGVVYAMTAVASGVPMGASHAIGHQLGPLGVGHGETSCVLLPAVCRYNWQQNANRSRQGAVKELLVKQPEVKKLLRAGSVDDLELGDVLHGVIEALGMPQTLDDVGIGEDQMPQLCKNSLEDPWIQTNAVPITDESQVMDILRPCRRS